MYERSTDSRQSKKSKKIHTAAEASDSQRMGAYWKRCGGSSEASNSSDDPVSVGQSTSARGSELFERQASQKKDAHTRELEEENRKLKEALACQTQELMLLKKRMNLV